MIPRRLSPLRFCSGETCYGNIQPNPRNHAQSSWFIYAFVSHHPRSARGVSVGREHARYRCRQQFGRHLPAYPMSSMLISQDMSLSSLLTVHYGAGKTVSFLHNISHLHQYSENSNFDCLATCCSSVRFLESRQHMSFQPAF